MSLAKCSRCNRPLKNEEAIRKGIGPVCEKKRTVNSVRRNESDTDEIVPYDGGDIFLERIPIQSELFPGAQVTMDMTHTATGIRTNIQRSIVRHSPTGYNFGYGGSGPAEAALNILRMFTDADTADHYYQDFKFKFLGKQGDKLVIPKQDILNFIQERKAAA